jgi:hypothetical protein
MSRNSGATKFLTVNRSVRIPEGARHPVDVEGDESNQQTVRAHTASNARHRDGRGADGVIGRNDCRAVEEKEVSSVMADADGDNARVMPRCGQLIVLHRIASKTQCQRRSSKECIAAC